MSVKQGTRVRLDHRGVGTVVQLLPNLHDGGFLPYANVRWDNGDESWEWVHNLLLVKVGT